MRKAKQTLTVIGVMALMLMGLALPASAHVRVNPTGTAIAGSYSEIYFRVPVEENSKTVKLEVSFPLNQPLAFALIRPHAGWTHATTMGKPTVPVKDYNGKSLAAVIATVTWTAVDGGLNTDEYDNFNVYVGPLPSAKTMEFKAIQTYANGDVVRWIEDPPAAGAAEPEHPAPILDISPAAAATTPAAAPTTSSGQASVTTTTMGDMAGMNMASSSTGSNTLPVILASVAIVIALIALGVVLLRRRPSNHTT